MKPLFSFVILAVVAAIGHAQDELPKVGPVPGYLDPVSEAESNFITTRVTGDPGSLIQGLDAHWNEVARHGYSKEPVWNADQSLILLRTHHGFPSMVFLNGHRFQPEFGRNTPPGTEMRWHPVDPDRMFYVNGNEIGYWNVRQDEAEAKKIFPEHTELQLGPWEGNLSHDGRFVALSGKKNSQPVAFVYDLKEGKKFPDISLSEFQIDWVSISASGRYVVCNGRYQEEINDQTWFYDREGNPVASPWLEYGRPSHFDLTIDENGDDVAVGVSKAKQEEGRVIKRRLRDGKITVLTQGGYADHTSTRNLNRPGWAYVTYQYRGKDWPDFQDEVIAVKLDGSFTVERIAPLRTNRTDYLTQAHATPSPDGSMVIWASNWESPSGRPIAAYVAKRVETESPHTD